MLRKIKQLRVTPSMAVALTALVLALTGASFAAGTHNNRGPVTVTAAKTKTKTKTGPRGPAGKNGAPGAAGPAGPAGPTGAKGETGATGPTGPTGPQGIQGEKGEAGPKGEKGEAGTAGTEGSPWTAGGTLPKGSSEHGQWVIGGLAKQGQQLQLYTAISFTIPLASAPGEAHSHFIGLEEGEGEAHPAAAITAGECKGTYKNPEAANGNVCIFVSRMRFLEPIGLLTLQNAEEELKIQAPPVPGIGAGKSGAVIALRSEANLPSEFQPTEAHGVWVATGE